MSCEEQDIIPEDSPAIPPEAFIQYTDDGYPLPFKKKPKEPYVDHSDLFDRIRRGDLEQHDNRDVFPPKRDERIKSEIINKGEKDSQFDSPWDDGFHFPTFDELPEDDKPTPPEDTQSTPIYDQIAAEQGFVR